MRKHVSAVFRNPVSDSGTMCGKLLAVCAWCLPHGIRSTETVSAFFSGKRCVSGCVLQKDGHDFGTSVPLFIIIFTFFLFSHLHCIFQVLNYLKCLKFFQSRQAAGVGFGVKIWI